MVWWFGSKAGSRSSLWGATLLTGAVACGGSASKGSGNDGNSASGSDGAQSTAASLDGGSSAGGSSSTDDGNSSSDEGGSTVDGNSSVGGTSSGGGGAGASATTSDAGTSLGGGAGTGRSGGGNGSQGGAGGGGGDGGNGSGGDPSGSGGSAGSGGASDTDLPGVLDDGVWLVGWAGGAEHYSWIRFSPDAEDGIAGTFAVLESGCLACVGFVPGCMGADGHYSVSVETNEVLMQYPAACSLGPDTWFFESVSLSPTGYLADGALLVWTVKLNDIDSGYSAYLFPSEQCDDAFTSCTSVWE